MAEYIHIVATEGAALQMQQGAYSIIEFDHPWDIDDPWAAVATAQMQFRSEPGGKVVLDTVSDDDDNTDWVLISSGKGSVKLHTSQTKDLNYGQNLKFDINLTTVDGEWNFTISGTIEIIGTITRTDDTEYQLSDPTREAALTLCLNETRENLIDAMLLTEAFNQFTGDIVEGQSFFYCPTALGDLLSPGDKIGIVLDATSGGYKTTHESTVDSVTGTGTAVVNLDDVFPGDPIVGAVIASSGGGVYRAHVGEQPL